MKVKLKKCRGTGVAIGNGCLEMIPTIRHNQSNRVYGLGKSCGCYMNWLLNTPEGKEVLEKRTIRAKVVVDKERKQAWNKEKSERKKKLKGKQDYEKDLEKWFNLYIRLRDIDEPCISCDAPPGSYTDSAGHFYPAGHYKNIRFDEDNVHSQCWYNCNKNKHGNLTEYRPRLIKKIGQKRFDELEQRRLGYAKFTINELQDMIVVYKQEVKYLLSDEN